tara:strand:+ start:75 stop:542 length:468 start_codon:yes stop_codon:yes gene_type:complete
MANTITNDPKMKLLKEWKKCTDTTPPTDHTEKMVMMAHLGAVPQGTRLITFYKRYRQTYEDTFVMLVAADAVLPDDFFNGSLLRVREGWNDKQDTYDLLMDYHGESIDNTNTEEYFEGVEVTDPDTEFDSQNTAHIDAVRIWAETIIEPVSVARV